MFGSTVFMSGQTVIAKKKRGPAPTGKGTQIVTRMQPDQLLRLDAWIAEQDGELSRPEAVRRLVDKALDAPARQAPKPIPPKAKPLKTARVKRAATKAGPFKTARPRRP
jgi:hypothetical protein